MSMNAFATLADLHALAPVGIALAARFIHDNWRPPPPPTRIIINVVGSPGAVVIVAPPQSR